MSPRAGTRTPRGAARANRAEHTETTRLWLRIDLGAEHKLGPGKIRLLESIAECGSISAAGRSMGMSYRRAWLLVESINQTFRQPAVETQHGGASGGGAALTPFGRALVARYRDIEQRASALVLEDLRALESEIAPPGARRRQD